MSLYEHVIITRPDMSSAQVEEFVADTIRKFENHGGKAGKTEYWGLRNLAYRVKKNRKAHYSLIEIDAPAAAIHEIERQHRINEDVLRYMSVRVEEFSADPSPILAKREERKRRDKRD
ncbi:30S ribosomal protein S6 [Fretibacter rubidus]|uniref:30S ribosomal protein S6 n=1 Tax=Fretibacter rubidus TaxID=570162 RepID=UPI00352A2C14